MREIKEKVQALVDRYASELAENRIKISVSKRYFEEDVMERTTNSSSGIFDIIFGRRERKREGEKYHYVNNRYHVIVLTVMPEDKSDLQLERCREYAFFLRKMERAYIGQEPRQIAYEEEKILFNIEKRILKIIKMSEKTSQLRVCQDNIFDAIRYSSSSKYGYKKSILGKDRYTWDIFITIAIAVSVLMLILMCWLLSK